MRRLPADVAGCQRSGQTLDLVFLTGAEVLQREVTDEILPAGGEIIRIEPQPGDPQLGLGQLFYGRIGVPSHQQHPFTLVVYADERSWLSQEEIRDVFGRQLVTGILRPYGGGHDEQRKKQR